MPHAFRYVLIGISAWALGACWALASPVGSSPDDDYHLTSIICMTGDESLCRDIDGAGPGTEVEVPSGWVGGACYAFQPDTSAACWQEGDDPTRTTRYNAMGGYPPTFYAAMSIFASQDIDRSVLLMRLAALTVALLVLGLGAWVSPLLADRQLVAWAVVSIPLGMFLFASTNPSSWGIAGLAAMWPASYALLHARDRRALITAALVTGLAAALCTARGDTAGIAAGLLGLVVVVFARSRAQIVAATIALMLAVVLMLALATAGQSTALSEGLVGAKAGSGVALLWSNLLELPDLWNGAFSGGLGWLDTPMPGSVWMPALVTAGALSVMGIRRLGWRRGIVLGAMSALLFAYPLLILQRSGAFVGTQFQPRYVLPVMFVVVGVALSPLEGSALRVSPPQRWFFVAATVVATCVAMHVQLRRYVTGLDAISINLNTNAEWTPLGLSPMAVWGLATIAAGALFTTLFALLAERRGQPDTAAMDHPSDEPLPGLRTG